MKNVTNFKEHDRSSRSLLLYGYGDGGGGPSIEMLEKARRLRDFDGLPQLIQEKALTFFEKAATEAKDLPVWVGELYLELHRGTYTSQARNKRGNRKSEFLLRDAEFFDALTFCLNRKRKENAVSPEYAVYDVSWIDKHRPNSHRAALNRAWKLVLLNQFHDIIPGSSIHWVYQDSARDYATVRQLGESVRESALGTLESLIHTQNFRSPVLVANTLSFSRREVVDLPNGEPALLDLPASGYTVVESAGVASTNIQNPVNATQTRAGITLENGLIRLRINKKGQLTSVYDLLLEREVLSETANVLRLYEDIPNQWDAWDMDIFHHEKFRVLDEIETLQVIESGPLRAAVKVVRKFGDSRLEQRIVLCANSARIDFPTEVDWQEKQKFLKVAFPVAIRAMNATYEIQYGHLERPTHTNTSWDLARFEVCAQKWADLSETGYGVALLNDCKYGYDIHDGVMCLSLLRAPISPDPLADRGRHQFTYALLPHAGDLRQGRVIEEAYALNVPPVIKELKPGTGPLPSSHSFFQLDRTEVIIEAVKIAEDGDAVIVRLYEASGARGPATLTTSLPVHHAWLTDLLEKQIKPLPFKNGRIQLDLAALRDRHPEIQIRPETRQPGR